MKNRHPNRRSKWAHINTPHGLRNRKAKADAKREAIAALVPAAYEPPRPGTHWQRIVIDLYVPTHGRCEQHAVMIDGQTVGLLGATAIAERVRGLIRPRPSRDAQAEVRRAEWREALAAHVGGRP
ncbi:hypothetical protein [Aquabacterium sp. OR-4]|uniref:hypothetical protein n=1 Tax=Aquabacterium sp. OR-4 TaxID=2978127 RepID=UPI0021B28040|nr:hypothetical protein [Aquabacterium sp. OR-4]MDT7835013.1 hypothetical protein [Aquabacterium sp. OR-4]